MALHLIRVSTNTQAAIVGLVTTVPHQWYFATDTDRYFVGNNAGNGVVGPIPSLHTFTDSTSIDFVATGTGGTLVTASVTIAPLTDLGAAPDGTDFLMLHDTSAGGLKKISVTNLLTSVAGGLTYQGTWNASTNTPILVSSVGTKGYYYVVSVSGATSINGVNDWVVGDWILFNGTIWEKADHTDVVSSINSQTGAVSLTASDGVQVVGNTDFRLNINGLGVINVPDPDADFYGYYDISSGVHKKSTVGNLNSYYNVTSLSSTTTLSEVHNTVLVDSTAGAVVLNLPAASTIPGRTYTIKAKTIIGAITIDPAAAETIDGSATKSLTVVDQTLSIQSDGSNWVILNNNNPTALTSLTLAGTSGTPQTLSSGDTITVAAGSGISTTAGATDTVTVALDISGLISDTPVGTDSFAFYDTSGVDNNKALLTALTFTLAGSSGTPQTPSLFSTVTLAGASGITTAASATNVITASLDISNLAAIGTVATGDLLAVYDISAVAHKKATIAEVLSVMSMSLAGDSGTPETIVNGNTITVSGGVGLASVVSAIDTVTVNLDFNSLSTGNVPDPDVDFYSYYDVSGATHLKSTLGNLGAYWNTTVASTITFVVDSTHNTILVDSTLNAVTLNLPAAGTIPGRIYTIKAEVVANTVTIDGSSLETIDGALTKVLTVADQTVTIQSNGANWVTLQEYNPLFVADTNMSNADLTFTGSRTHTMNANDMTLIQTNGTYKFDNASARLIVTTADVEIATATKGLVLKDSGGARWRITIDTNGALTSTSI